MKHQTLYFALVILGMGALVVATSGVGVFARKADAAAAASVYSAGERNGHHERQM